MSLAWEFLASCFAGLMFLLAHRVIVAHERKSFGSRNRPPAAHDGIQAAPGERSGRESQERVKGNRRVA